jgi:protein O-mannosyl-transferase
MRLNRHFDFMSTTEMNGGFKKYLVEVPAMAAILAALLVISQSIPWDAPFVFDDIKSIVQNATIRHPGDWRAITHPPSGGVTVQSRPLLNLTLAIDYARGALDPKPYRLTNVLIHGMNSFLLFIILRMVLASTFLPSEVRRNSKELSFISAIIWLCHPISTGVVTYVVQRAESLATCFVLLAVAMGIQAKRFQKVEIGLGCSAACCFAGVLASLSKEIAIIIPISIYLISAAYFEGDFLRELHKRWGHYVCYSLATVPLTWYLVLSGGGRGGTVGAGDTSSLAYLYGQGEIIARYAVGFLTGQVQVFDFGQVKPPTPFGSVCFLIVSAYVVFSLILLFRRPTVGVPMFIPLLILGPTSSIIPIQTQAGIFHRFYLPSACITALLTSLAVNYWPRHLSSRPFGFATALSIVFFYGYGTVRRSQDYKDPEVLWEKSFSSWPNSKNAVEVLTKKSLARGDWPRIESIHDRYIRAGGEALFVGRNLAKLFLLCGREADAIAIGQELVQKHPDNASLWNELSFSLSVAGRYDQAIAAVDQAITLNPVGGRFFLNRAEYFRHTGDAELALRDFRTGLLLEPTDETGYFGLGSFFIDHGKFRESLSAFRKAIAIRADYHEAMYWVAWLYRLNGDYAESRYWILEALKYGSKPTYQELLDSLQGELSSFVS